MLTEELPFATAVAWLGSVLGQVVAGEASRLRWPSASSIVRW